MNVFLMFCEGISVGIGTDWTTVLFNDLFYITFDAELGIKKDSGGGGTYVDALPLGTLL